MWQRSSGPNNADLMWEQGRTDMTWSRRNLLVAGAALAATPLIGAAPDVTPRIRRVAPGLDRILDSAQPVETLVTGIRWAEGPLWVPGGGFLLFSDPPANILRAWS